MQRCLISRGSIRRIYVNPSADQLQNFLAHAHGHSLEKLGFESAPTVGICDLVRGFFLVVAYHHAGLKTQQCTHTVNVPLRCCQMQSCHAVLLTLPRNWRALFGNDLDDVGAALFGSGVEHRKVFFVRILKVSAHGRAALLCGRASGSK
jgi:hypothetical protein